MRNRKYFPAALSALLLFVCLSACGTAGEAQVYSPQYGIDRQAGLIGRIQAGTAEQTLLEGFVSDGQLTLTDGVKTGSQLLVTRSDSVDDRLQLVVAGDCDSDGAFTSADLETLRIFLQKKVELTPAQQQAADMDCDGAVSNTDYFLMKQLLADGQAPNSAPLAPLPQCFVLTPGQTMELPGNSFTMIGNAVSRNANTITARKLGLSQVSTPEGSYLFLVSQQPQQAILPQSMELAARTNAQLTPQFSLPVNTGYSYESSDPTIATVDENGLICALKAGQVTITCTPNNGRSGQLQLRVLPLADTITLSAQELKVRSGGYPKTLTAQVLPADAVEPLIWTSSDPELATVDENGNIHGLKNGYVTISCTGAYSGVSASCQVKVCNLIQVALTFDDGPSTSTTGQLLDILKQYDVPATFFMVGRMLSSEKALDLVRRMVEDGHELGYHTMYHSQFAFTSRETIAKEYAQFQTILEEACGKKATVFRGPGGRVNDRAHEEIGLPYIYWTRDTRDWETKDAAAVRSAVLTGLWDGCIILLHDIHPTTVSGVKQALSYIMADEDLDVEFLTVTQLLTRDGKEAELGIVHYDGY